MGLERRGGRRTEIERVVLPLTVTESEPLSCCHEKNTEAHISCTLTLFPIALNSPLVPSASSLPLTLSFPPEERVVACFTGFYRLKMKDVKVDLCPCCDVSSITCRIGG